MGRVHIMTHKLKAKGANPISTFQRWMNASHAKAFFWACLDSSCICYQEESIHSNSKFLGFIFYTWLWNVQKYKYLEHLQSLFVLTFDQKCFTSKYVELHLFSFISFVHSPSPLLLLVLLVVIEFTYSITNSYNLQSFKKGAGLLE